MKGIHYVSRFFFFFFFGIWVFGYFQQHLLKRLSLHHCTAFVPLSNISGLYLLLLLLFSHPIVSDSLWPYGLQHSKPACVSPSPDFCPSSCPLDWWYHPANSSSNAIVSFYPQSFPESGTFPMSQLFTSDDQNTGASTSASVLPINIQGWFPLSLTGLISLLSKGLSGIFSSTTIWR